MVRGHRKEDREVRRQWTQEFIMGRCNPDITYVGEIVVVTRCPPITQGTGRFIGVIKARSKSLLHLTSGDCYVCQRPPHSFCVPIFSTCDQPEPANVLLKVR